MLLHFCQQLKWSRSLLLANIPNWKHQGFPTLPPFLLQNPESYFWFQLAVQVYITLAKTSYCAILILIFSFTVSGSQGQASQVLILPEWFSCPGLNKNRSSILIWTYLQNRKLSRAPQSIVEWIVDLKADQLLPWKCWKHLKKQKALKTDSISSFACSQLACLNGWSRWSQNKQETLD